MAGDSWPDPDVGRRWAAGRLAAIQQAPYLATALLALEPLVVRVPASSSDPEGALRAFPADSRWRVHVNPARLAGVTVAELAYWLLHQVAHLLRDHAARGERMGGPPRRWNAAADLEVSDDLPEPVPAGSALVPERVGLPRHWLAEQYWQALDGRRLDDLAVCGAQTVSSGANGGPPGVGIEESRLLREEVARAVATRARSRDDVPGGWARWAQQVLDPVVDWRRELTLVIRRMVAVASGRVDHTYRRRSRRQAAVPDVILPGLQQPRPTIAVVLDTSASMGQARLDRAVAELGGIIRAAGIAERAVHVLCCDTKAHEASRAWAARSVRLLGGGGTDLREGLAAAAALRPRPDLVMVLTDGETEWPHRPPRGVHVVVGLLVGGRRPPGWARTVDVPEDTGGDGVCDVVDRT